MEQLRAQLAEPAGKGFEEEARERESGQSLAPMEATDRGNTHTGYYQEDSSCGAAGWGLLFHTEVTGKK